jgi:hypothetical protein
VVETGGLENRLALTGYGGSNPSPSAKTSSKRKVDDARIDAKELPDLLKRIEFYQGTHVTRLAMKLLAMMFVRTSESIEAKWPNMVFEAWPLRSCMSKDMRTSILNCSLRTLRVMP